VCSSDLNKIGIPIVAIVDTNADPSQVTYPIPANDDAIKSLQLIADYIASAVNEGKAKAAKSAPTPDKDEAPAVGPTVN
jgi:small subunit ribosomal protein S2